MPSKPFDDNEQSQEDQLNQPSNTDIKAFEASLSQFAPRSVSLDRDAVLFAAGKASCEPMRPQSRQLRGYRAWQGATIAMSMLSLTLGTMLAQQATMEPRIVIVERPSTSVTDQVRTSPTTGDVVMPPSVINRPQAIAIIDDADDKHLAEAWKARREMIAASDHLDRQLATASHAVPAADSQERPLTRSSLLGDQSQDTIQRWLKEQL